MKGAEHLTWDAWGHYHIMLGLLLWYRQSEDGGAIQCAERIADLFCRMFLEGGRRLVSIGSADMNLAPIHALCLLHELTGKDRYLAMAREIERACKDGIEDNLDPGCVDVFRKSLAHAYEMMKLSMTEMQGHAAKGKWG